MKQIFSMVLIKQILWSSLAVALVLLGVSELRAETESFESLADFELGFQSSSPTAPQWSATGGMGGSGGLLPGTEAYVACVRSDQPLPIRPGQTVTVAMSFLYGKQATRIAERNAGVFLATTQDTSPVEGAEGSSLSAYFFNVSNESEQTTICTASGASQGLSEQGVSWSDSSWWDSAELEGHWCRMKVQFTKMSQSGMWEVAIQILDLGEFGDSERELLSLTNLEIHAELLYAAPEIYAGFQNLRLGRGFNAMDDFEVTIE